jgi:hypothetical protein
LHLDTDLDSSASPAQPTRQKSCSASYPGVSRWLATLGSVDRPRRPDTASGVTVPEPNHAGPWRSRATVCRRRTGGITPDRRAWSVITLGLPGSLSGLRRPLGARCSARPGAEPGQRKKSLGTSGVRVSPRSGPCRASGVMAPSRCWVRRGRLSEDAEPVGLPSPAACRRLSPHALSVASLRRGHRRPSGHLCQSGRRRLGHRRRDAGVVKIDGSSRVFWEVRLGVRRRR